MLAQCKLITEKEKDAIVKGLNEILSEILAGKFEFKESLEDVHMNIESALIERIGEAGKNSIPPEAETIRLPLTCGSGLVIKFR